MSILLRKQPITSITLKTNIYLIHILDPYENKQFKYSNNNKNTLIDNEILIFKMTQY